jgi:hypothetical protein
VLSAVPPWHTLFISQQPVQLALLHEETPPEELEPLGAAHPPPLQTWPDAQALQLSPPEPHAVSSVPAWHTVFASQQPLHIWALHEGATPPELLPPPAVQIIGPWPSGFGLQVVPPKHSTVDAQNW